MTKGYHDDPDVQRMLRVQKGDEVAFEELVASYGPMLLNFMRRFVGDDPLGEDLAQEVFLRVHRAAPNYRPTAKFKTWLLTIATNLCLNEKRRSARALILSIDRDDEESPSNAPQLADEGPMPSEGMENEELRSKVRCAIAELPDNQRVAILLARFEELSYVEIAETMELTIMAVKSLLNRARANLKETLARELRDDFVAPPEGSV